MSTTKCREWQGSRNNHGYGTRYGTQYGTRYVHRQVWIMANGPIPPGKVIMHSCDNPACFLLAHLSLGTMADNNADKAAKGRARNGFADRTHCIHGHEFTPENTYNRPTGGRSCRACNLIRKQNVEEPT